MALLSTFSGVRLQNVRKNRQMETQPLTQRKTGSGLTLDQSRRPLSQRETWSGSMWMKQGVVEDELR